MTLRATAILDQRGPRFRQSEIRIGFPRRGSSRQAREKSAEASDVVVGEVRRNRRHLLVLARRAAEMDQFIFR
jgi:hypothetical protein